MDRDFWQDRRVDELAEKLREEHLAAEGNTTEILARLRRELDLRKSELERQSLAISALTELLTEQGVVDAGVLRTRFEQKLAKLEADAQLVACARCKTRVDRSVTMLTGSGAMCPNCYHSIHGDE